MSTGMKRPRLPEPAGRGRGGGRGGRGRGRGGGRGLRGAPARAAQLQLQLQLPARPPPPTEPRGDVQSTTEKNAESGSDSDNDAPEVLSAKRPPGIEVYESSSSDVEPEKPQIATATAAVDDHSLIADGAAASSAHPPMVLNVNARPTDVTRKVPPPQPKKPPRNPFAARTSLLRSVSEHICYRL